MAAKLSEAGGRFYVENLPGAGGMIGTATAARALPDGCTMVIVNQNFVVQPAIVQAFVPSNREPAEQLPVARHALGDRQLDAVVRADVRVLGCHQ